MPPKESKKHSGLASIAETLADATSQKLQLHANLQPDIRMIIPEAEYITFLHNANRFVVQTNPSPHPATVDVDAVIRESQVAEHKAEKAEFETYCGVENFLRKAIIHSVDPEWIAKLESEMMGFNHRTPIKLLTHL